MNTFFEKWCQKLLDTGRKNKLINFKETKLGTIEVIAPSISLLFQKITNGEILSFYNIDEYIRKIKSNDETTNFEKNDYEIDKSETKEEIINKLSSILNKKQLLAYKKGIDANKIFNNIKK